ncbi:uncharacterized protein LOC135085893 [Ostrinia nubilalis]|uniref:uncharacterized protein LOC135085893 n=1 Tax=Ostrinia nubilalis TaxID=29057 RepID=UPI0030826380
MPVTRSRKGKSKSSQPATPPMTSSPEPTAQDMTSSQSAVTAQEELMQLEPPPVIDVTGQHSTASPRATLAHTDCARRLAEAEAEIARLELELAIARRKLIEIESDEEDDLAVSKQEHCDLQPQLPSTVTAPQPTSSKIDLTELASAIATAARAGQQQQYVAELPNFSGAHYDWLAFKAAYTETASSFSELENIARLRRSLTGRAKEAVTSLLIVNAKAQDIMRTLEMRFGRPDSIALSEIDTLRSLQRLTDSPEQICVFASRIQNSVATLRILGRTHYLYNPEIVYSLTDKLTPALRYRWYDFAWEHTEEEPDLIKFSRFIEREAEKCAKFAAPEPIYREHSYPHREIQNTQRVFHIEEKTVQRSSCPVCDGNHPVTECGKIRKAASSERWDIAKQNRLCFRCLRPWNRAHRCPGIQCRKQQPSC